MNGIEWQEPSKYEYKEREQSKHFLPKKKIKTITLDFPEIRKATQNFYMTRAYRYIFIETKSYFTGLC